MSTIVRCVPDDPNATKSSLLVAYEDQTNTVFDYVPKGYALRVGQEITSRDELEMSQMKGGTVHEGTLKTPQNRRGIPVVAKFTPFGDKKRGIFWHSELCEAVMTSVLAQLTHSCPGFMGIYQYVPDEDGAYTDRHIDSLSGTQVSALAVLLGVTSRRKNKDLNDLRRRLPCVLLLEYVNPSQTASAALAESTETAQVEKICRSFAQLLNEWQTRIPGLENFVHGDMHTGNYFCEAEKLLDFECSSFSYQGTQFEDRTEMCIVRDIDRGPSPSYDPVAFLCSVCIEAPSVTLPLIAKAAQQTLVDCVIKGLRAMNSASAARKSSVRQQLTLPSDEMKEIMEPYFTSDTNKEITVTTVDQVEQLLGKWINVLGLLAFCEVVHDHVIDERLAKFSCTAIIARIDDKQDSVVARANKVVSQERYQLQRPSGYIAVGQLHYSGTDSLFDATFVPAHADAQFFVDVNTGVLTGDAAGGSYTFGAQQQVRPLPRRSDGAQRAFAECTGNGNMSSTNILSVAESDAACPVRALLGSSASRELFRVVGGDSWFALDDKFLHFWTGRDAETIEKRLASCLSARQHTIWAESGYTFNPINDITGLYIYNRGESNMFAVTVESKFETCEKDADSVLANAAPVVEYLARNGTIYKNLNCHALGTQGKVLNWAPENVFGGLGEKLPRDLANPTAVKIASIVISLIGLFAGVVVPVNRSTVLLMYKLTIGTALREAELWEDVSSICKYFEGAALNAQAFLAARVPSLFNDMFFFEANGGIPCTRQYFEAHHGHIYRIPKSLLDDKAFVEHFTATHLNFVTPAKSESVHELFLLVRFTDSPHNSCVDVYDISDDDSNEDCYQFEFETTRDAMDGFDKVVGRDKVHMPGFGAFVEHLQLLYTFDSDAKVGTEKQRRDIFTRCSEVLGL